MGTRHMIAVISGERPRVAQYGQWDGYPSGQGVDILNFLSNNQNLSALRANALNCSFISEEEYQILLDEYKALAGGSDKFLNMYPQFSRDTGAGILSLVAKAEDGIKLMDSYNFAADSLFCEWAYVIDLDNKTFEVYKGFNKTPLSKEDRFFGITDKIPSDRDLVDTYHPVKLHATFKLSDLPSSEEFLLKCEPPEESSE